MKQLGSERIILGASFLISLKLSFGISGRDSFKGGRSVTTHFCKPGKLVVILSCEKFGANKNFISYVA
jgi:hypothetical protein